MRTYAADHGKVTPEYLNSFLPENKQVDFSSLYSETAIRLEEAREKYPDWYQRKIIKKSLGEPGLLMKDFMNGSLKK